MFESFKKKSLDRQLDEAMTREVEEELYAKVLQEIERGERRDGLWAKALVAANGDESIAKAQYIKLRVQSLKNEAKLAERQQKIEDDIKLISELAEEAEKRKKKNKEAYDSWLEVVLAEDMRRHELSEEIARRARNEKLRKFRIKRVREDLKKHRGLRLVNHAEEIWTIHGPNGLKQDCNSLEELENFNIWWRSKS
jgi:hypothetical protein